MPLPAVVQKQIDAIKSFDPTIEFKSWEHGGRACVAAWSIKNRDVWNMMIKAGWSRYSHACLVWREPARG